LLKTYLAALFNWRKFTARKKGNMQTYLKSRPVGMQLLLFIGMAFGIFSIFGVLGATLLPSITGIDLATFQDSTKWDASNPSMIIFIRGMLLLQFLGLFLIPGLLFGYYSDPKPMHYLGFRKPQTSLYIILGIGAMLLAIPFVEFAGILNKKMIPGEDATQWVKSLEENANRQIKFMLGKGTITEYLSNLLFIAVFAGVGEELFFRGILQRLFIKLTKNPWIGIILTAILFSGFHLQFYGFIPRLFLGIVLGAIYWFSGSLWPAIIAHFVYDAFLISLIYMQPNLIQDEAATMVAPSMMGIMAVISLALVLFLVWRMVKMSRSTYEEEYKNDNPPDGLSF
jgi:uncharacterized protein